MGLCLLQLLGPREAAASICCSLWEGGLVGVVGTLLQAYQERSGLLRSQSLHTLVTPLLPGSMMREGSHASTPGAQVVAEVAIHPPGCLLEQVE